MNGCSTMTSGGLFDPDSDSATIRVCSDRHDAIFSRREMANQTVIIAAPDTQGLAGR